MLKTRFRSATLDGACHGGEEDSGVDMQHKGPPSTDICGRKEVEGGGADGGGKQAPQQKKKIVMMTPMMTGAVQKSLMREVV